MILLSLYVALIQCVLFACSALDPLTPERFEEIRKYTKKSYQRERGFQKYYLKGIEQNDYKGLAWREAT